MMAQRDRLSMLVPFDGSAAAERVLRTAARAAKEDDTSLLVLAVVPVPAGRSADELPIEASALTMRALVKAQAICREEKVNAVFEETYARDLADEIVKIANQMNACVIALPLDYQGDIETELMSPTVQRVLAEAPCTVMLDSHEEYGLALAEDPQDKD